MPRNSKNPLDNKRKNDIAYRILKTCAITLIYGIAWMLLEQLIYGQITNDIVDNIIMLAFMPVIWKAIKNHEEQTK